MDHQAYYTPQNGQAGLPGWLVASLLKTLGLKRIPKKYAPYANRRVRRLMADLVRRGAADLGEAQATAEALANAATRRALHPGFRSRALHVLRVPHATARTAPRPRAPAIPRPRPSAPTTSASPSTAPPGEGGNKGGDGLGGDGDPPSPPRTQPAKAKAKRGRPRRRRAFRLWPDGKAYAKRLKALDAVAEALKGRPDALFVTLTPITPPTKEDRKLARISDSLVDAFNKLKRDLRYRGVIHTLVPATRGKNGAFYIHWHGLLGGIGRAELEKLASRRGFGLTYAQPLQDPRAAARYAMAAHQKKYWDGIVGGRGFAAYIPRNLPPVREVQDAAPEAEAPAQVLQALAAAPPPGPVVLGPGVVVVDPPRFIAAVLQDLDGPPVLRRAALDQARTFLAALTTTGPPSPSPPTGKGGGPRVP